MPLSIVSGRLDHTPVGWVRPLVTVTLSRRHCAVEELMAGVARGLVDAQLALDLRTDERMKALEEDGIPPSGIMLGHCRLALNVSAAIKPRRDFADHTRVLVAPRRQGSTRIVFGIRRGANRRGRS